MHLCCDTAAADVAWLLLYTASVGALDADTGSVAAAEMMFLSLMHACVAGAAGAAACCCCCCCCCCCGGGVHGGECCFRGNWCGGVGFLLLLQRLAVLMRRRSLRSASHYRLIIPAPSFFSFYSQKISTSNVVSSDDNDKDIDVQKNSSSSTYKTNRYHLPPRSGRRGESAAVSSNAHAAQLPAPR